MNIKISSKAALLLVMLSVSGMTAAEQARTGSSNSDEVLIGKVYDKHSNMNDLLFNFRRTEDRDGDRIRVTRTYTYPNGRVAAVERATYDKHKLRSYTLIEEQIDARGRAELQDKAQAGAGTITLRYEKDGESYTNDEDLVAATVVNDNIVRYLHANWNELMQGREVGLRYIVIPRTETVAFSIVKSGETTWQGKPAVLIEMTPSNWFISLVVDPVYFTVLQENRRVVQYEGRVTPKIKEDGEWQGLDAVMVFR